MEPEPTTVKEYLDALPADRKKAVQAIRKVIRANIDKDFKEGIQYGTIAWFLPHSKYPAGYHCDPSQPLPFAGLAARKNHIAISMFCLYGNEPEEAKFRKEWAATGKRLDMGKACVRVKKLEDAPLDVIGRVFKRMTAKKFVAFYESAIAPNSKKTRAPAKKKSSGSRGKR